MDLYARLRGRRFAVTADHKGAAAAVGLDMIDEHGAIPLGPHPLRAPHGDTGAGMGNRGYLELQVGERIYYAHVPGAAAFYPYFCKACVLSAFQRRFRREAVTGAPDSDTAASFPSHPLATASEAFSLPRAVHEKSMPDFVISTSRGLYLPLTTELAEIARGLRTLKND